jgi:hypothetical protein
MNIFTRREKIFLLVYGLVGITMVVFPSLHDPDYEIIYLLLIVLPLGILIVTDKERLARLTKKDNDDARE